MTNEEFREIANVESYKRLKKHNLEKRTARLDLHRYKINPFSRLCFFSGALWAFELLQKEAKKR